MAERLPAEVVYYVAMQSVRRYGEIEPTLPDKLRRNIRRNHGLSVDRARILRLARRYKDIYRWAARALPRFLSPPRGRYVDVEDVDTQAFEAALRKHCPREPRAVRRMIAWYVILYEYLK